MEQRRQLAAPVASSQWRWHLTALALAAGGLAVAGVLISLSDGFYHDDDLTHYNFARAGWHSAGSLLYRWARPGYNVPAAVVAHWGGLLGCRIFSALQTAAVGFLAYLIARRIGVPPAAAAMAPALVWLQPLTMTLACTTLTETPAALYLSLGVWLYLRGNRVWGCAAVSATFITREETLALAPVIVAAVALDALRQADWHLGRAMRTGWAWACAAALLWAPLAYATAAVAVGLEGDASPLNILTNRYTAEYGTGDWLHYLPRWILAFGAGVIALAVAGTIHLRKRAWMVWALALGLVVAHTVIYRYGLFASGGYGRFLIPVSGLTAALAAGGLAATAGRKNTYLPAESVFLVLAAAVIIVQRYAPVPVLPTGAQILGVLLAGAAGVTALASGQRLRRVLRLAAAGTAAVFIVTQAGAFVRPLTIAASPHHTVVADCIRRLDRTRHAGRCVLTTHLLVPYLRDNAELVEDPGDGMRRWLAARPGTLFLWSNKYGGWPTDEHPVSPLYTALEERGRLVTWSDNFRGDWAGVFVRVADELPAMTAPSTQSERLDSIGPSSRRDRADRHRPKTLRSSAREVSPARAFSTAASSSDLPPA